MDKFAKEIGTTIRRESLLRPRGKVVVALSGGADSVALLSTLVELGYECVAAHCNFHLRGEESNRDMRFVARFTERLGVDLYIKEFDVRARMRESGESVEMACRALRYDWFGYLLDRERAQAVAVGHHREDQVETFFLNLLRGSGVAGLGGMRHRTAHIVRPLLDASRADIEAYLGRKGLGWVTDSTNASDEFARNRLRNRLVPLFEELFPGTSDAVVRTMAHLRETRAFFERAAAERIKLYADATSGDINLRRLLADEPQAPLLLFERLKAEGFNRTQTDDMLEAAQRGGGQFRAGATHLREVDHGMLRRAHAAQPISADEHEVTLRRDIYVPITIEVTLHDISEFEPRRDPNVAYIDAAALDGNHRWALRHWRRADRMTPYGMTGSKLVSDIFAQAKMSARQKAEAWLLTCDDEVVWAVGVRASGRFAVGPSSRKYLRLEFLATDD